MDQPIHCVACLNKQNINKMIITNRKEMYIHVHVHVYIYTAHCYDLTSLLVAALLAVYITVHYVKESTCLYLPLEQKDSSN